jgi:hypothetical protein
MYQTSTFGKFSMLLDELDSLLKILDTICIMKNFTKIT